MQIENKLACIWGRKDEYFPDDMVGAKIINIGSPVEFDLLEGGGLIIDYQTTQGDIKRVVFSFNECGMWIENRLHFPQ